MFNDQHIIYPSPQQISRLSHRVKLTQDIYIQALDTDVQVLPQVKKQHMQILRNEKINTDEIN